LPDRQFIDDSCNRLISVWWYLGESHVIHYS
jgi:hypothetical protein